MRNLKQFSFGVAAGCAAALAIPSPAPAAETADPDDAALAQLRASGPAALPPLLDRYDHMAPGPDRDALALSIDKVAGQRYATVSRLYWYTRPRHRRSGRARPEQADPEPSHARPPR
jgi:hypothetical protein